MLIGAQVRQTGGWVAALHRAEDMGAEVIQLFAQSNRQWRPPLTDPSVYEGYRAAAAASPVVSVTVCHAPYLINLISPDPVTRSRSRHALVANLLAATALGAIGLVLHPGSHRGVDPDTALERIAAALVSGLDEAEAAAGAVCDLLLENTAGAGGTVGRSVTELAGIIRSAGSDWRLGVCVDTQHLWASGTSYRTLAEADRAVRGMLGELGPGRLRCLHVNDSKVPLGSNVDRHENLGSGLIGARGLQAILGHPALQGLPAVLEVPGVERGGPAAEDLETARALHRRGLAAWRRRSGRAGPGGRGRDLRP